MRKIDLTDYQIQANGPDGKTIEVAYAVRRSLVGLLFNSNIQPSYTYADTLEVDALAMKIMDAEDNILLEESEYKRLDAALKAARGFGRNEVELIRRVVEAEQVRVMEAVE